MVALDDNTPESCIFQGIGDSKLKVLNLPYFLTPQDIRNLHVYQNAQSTPM